MTELHELTSYMHLIAPLVGSIVYTSWVPSFQMTEISSGQLRLVALVHNALLTCFSAWAFWQLIEILQDKGVVFRAEYYFSDERFRRVVFLFYLSKYYEYVDTVLLFLKRKQPIFLQTFHHLGAVLAWHLSYFYRVDAVMWATLTNAFVHSFMYAYYGFSLFKLPGLRRCKPVITALQILQLVAAVIISPVAYFPPVETSLRYAIVVGFNIYICILVYLFANFAKDTYLTKKRDK